MSGKSGGEPQSDQEATGSEDERRRPGRVAYENPELIKLLRDSASTEVGSAADVPRAEGEAAWKAAVERADGGLRAAKSIIVIALLSFGLWIIIGSTIWFLLS
jgi:hypothetical protein